MFLNNVLKFSFVLTVAYLSNLAKYLSVFSILYVNFDSFLIIAILYVFFSNLVYCYAVEFNRL